MSTAPVTAPSSKPPRAKKDKERKLSQPQQGERLKTVVRRLPPNLPEDIFWQSVQQWVTEETSTWRMYYPGKLRKKLNKENIPSRAYIAFKNEEQLALFSREYDGHVFRDKTGAESQAVVEFAPYPKIPSEKRKADNRNATIEKDEDYLSFLEALKASENTEPVSLESLIASTQPAPLPKTTPLLEALKAEKSAAKDKEAILRNHPHYQISANTSRKDEKKKLITVAAASRPADAPSSNAPNTSAPGGKKAMKKAQAAAAAQGSASGQTPKAPPSNNLGPANKGSGNVNNAGGSGQVHKAPKAPRPPRQPKTAAAAVPGPTTSAPALPKSPVVTVLPTPAPPNAPAIVSSNPTAQASTSRRTRPVIGIASRQFEAALSGVAGLASAATERKRREKEREMQSAGGSINSKGNGQSGSSSTFARIDGSDTERDKEKSGIPPPSPRKEKTRRGNRGGGGSGAGRGDGAGDAAASTDAAKVPSILQRNDGPPPTIIQRDASDGSSAKAPAAAQNAPANLLAGGNGGSGGNPRGGGRRGRGGGGGRGRGGPPGGPRGGG